LYQHYWEFGPGETLIDEHRTDSSNSGWSDRLVKLSYSTSNTVLIFVALSAQIRLLHIRILKQIPGGAGHHQPAGLDHVAPMGELQRQPRVLLDQEDRGALRR
jgi:hypothetical protein